MPIARCWVKGFREAVHRCNANATRQPLITEMFPKTFLVFLIIKFVKLEVSAQLEITPKFSFEQGAAIYGHVSTSRAANEHLSE